MKRPSFILIIECNNRLFNGVDSDCLMENLCLSFRDNKNKYLYKYLLVSILY